MSIITNIIAREILDSRGNPTVEVDLHLEHGLLARAASPSGASVGSKEAHELRDHDHSRFNGKGVLKAVNNINTIIKPALLGRDCLAQNEIDSIMLDLDGTHNKSKLGANAITATSIAVLKAAALSQRKSLFQYLNKDAVTLPIPLMNILNGGIHANNGLSIQEFMIMPVGAKSIKDAIRIGTEVFHKLKSILVKRTLSTNVGDEGGFAPEIKHTRDAIELLLLAISEAGFKAGSDIILALDVAASEFYRDGKYHLKSEEKILSSDGLIKYYEKLVSDYPIYSIEDGMAEDDFDGWTHLTAVLGDKIQLVGDDVFVTNKKVFAECMNKHIANAILIKPNQIGTITETFDAINFAHANRYSCVLSHRSGETEDTTITHLAVAGNCNQIKIGSLCRTDRISKYNELIRIEEQLDVKAKYAEFNKISEILTL